MAKRASGGGKGSPAKTKPASSRAGGSARRPPAKGRRTRTAMAHNALETLVENCPLAIICTDTERTVTLWNLAAEAMFGWSRDEVIGRFNPIVPEPKMREYIRLSEHVRQGMPYRGKELKRVRKDGSAIYINISSAPLRNEEGEVIGMMAITEDISEKKLSERALKEEYAFRKALEDSVGAGIAAMDLDYRQTYVNPAFCRMTGWTEDELVGQKAPFRYWPPEAAGEIKAVLDKVIGGELPGSGMELKFLSRAGDMFDVLLVPSALRDEKGRVRGCLVSVHDIRERKKTEEELRRTSMLTRVAMDALPCVALLLRPDREIVVSNASGLREGAAPGMKCYASWGGRDKPCPWCLASDALATGKAQHVEVESEGVVWDAYWIPVGSDLCLHYAFDISERRQNEDMMRSSLREKEALLREIHHRVKNNLQIVSSLLKLQSQHIDDAHLLARITDTQNRIRSMALVHEKLYLSGSLASIDFPDYAKGLTDSLLKAYPVPVPVRLTLDVDDISFGPDAAIPCGLIINELVSNSLKYAFRGRDSGRILVSLKRTGEGLFDLTVSDDGVGLPEGLRAGGFETLGLQLATMIAEDQLRGNVVIDGRAGTEFRISFSEPPYTKRL